MVVYSVWRPDGGYDYYETPSEIAALGNDLPVPNLKSAGPIGVPSVEAGRPVPAGARHVGSGREVQGLVAPTDMSRLGFAVGNGAGSDPRALWFALGAITISVAWAVHAYVRRR